MSGVAVTDEELVARCRRGDDAAWSLLVERFSRFVYAISVRGFRLAEHDAEEVFQDVFTKAFESLGTLRDDSAIRPWIAQLTRRCCIDRIRRSRETPVDDLDLAPDESALADVERALDVHQALATLSEECQEILDRFFARDESYRTIGEVLGIPAGTIASRISRCLGRMKTAMEDSGPLARPVDG